MAQVGQPVIEQLRDVSQCSSHLAIRDGRDIIYIARVSAAGSRINQVSIGTRLPVHCTSLGRMLLTDISRAEFEQLFPHERLGNTPGSFTTAKPCGRWCSRTKPADRSANPSSATASSIVYPVYDRSGRVAAVVSILVPRRRSQTDRERLQTRFASRRIKFGFRVPVTGQLNQ
ncbi:IclR family transcriptional regulator domain-containing protein [Enterobacter mori]